MSADVLRRLGIVGRCRVAPEPGLWHLRAALDAGAPLALIIAAVRLLDAMRLDHGPRTISRAAAAIRLVGLARELNRQLGPWLPTAGPSGDLVPATPVVALIAAAFGRDAVTGLDSAVVADRTVVRRRERRTPRHRCLEVAASPSPTRAGPRRALAPPE